MIAIAERVYIIFPRETTQGTAAPSTSGSATPASGSTPAATDTPAGAVRRAQRRVVSFEASPLVGNDGYWDFNPMPSGRSEPTLPGDGELVDACATDLGPSVLLAPIANEAEARAGASGAVATTSWRLLVLNFSAWNEVTLPQEIQTARWVRIVDGLLLAQMPGEKDARAWRITLTSTPAKPAVSIVAPNSSPNSAPIAAPNAQPSAALLAPVPAAPAPATTKPLPRFEALDARIELPAGQELRTLVFASVDGQLVCTPHTARPEALWSLAPGRAPLTIAPDPLPEATEFAFVPLAGASRIAFLTAGPPASTSARPQDGSPVPSAAPADSSQTPLPMRQIRVVEVSTSTGQVLFNDVARRDAVITARDLQALAIGIGVLTAAVFLFVLRQDNRHTVRIPLRTSLATPARRFAGALIDLVLGYAIASLLLDRSIVRIITQAGPHLIANMMTLVIVTLLCAAIHSMLSEWLTGRSLGKFMTGSVVTRAVVERGDEVDPPVNAGSPDAPDASPAPARLPQGDRPAPDAIPPITFVQAGLRNLIRWTPPLAMLLAFDPNFRHPGDVLSRTVVIVPDPEDERDALDED